MILPSHSFENTNQVIAKSKAPFYPSCKRAHHQRPVTINTYSYLLLEKEQGKFKTLGSDVEQSIISGDVTKRKWLQIAYFGYMQRVQKVHWVNNNTFLLVSDL